MQPFQQRVVTEKSELDAKLTALDAFIDSPSFDELPIKEKELLARQSQLMTEYSEVLGARIKAFL